MFGSYNSSRFGSDFPVVTNLIILNVLMLLVTMLVQSTMGINLNSYLGLYYFQSEYFRPWQYITYLFMHGGFLHLIMNMWALWMFGKVLERVWGSQRFFVYYFVTGIGAALLHTLVNHFILADVYSSVVAFSNTPSPEAFQSFIREHIPNAAPGVYDFINQWQEDPSNPQTASIAIAQLNGYLQSLADIPTVGASGAIFGILMAFGMLFPNTQLMLLIPPIPIKAKWFVLGYGAIELYLGISQPGSSVAHFAHLGGMLFGYVLIRYWNSKRGPNLY
ncbi:MAG: rhomboid family intramembrane serine protease [Bacteroidales bacterium]|nr:rhomboid family intramembrane serine protease [Bacteroidales bacterium]